VGPDGVRFAFRGAAGRCYQLESAEHLGDAWTLRSEAGPLSASEDVLLADPEGATFATRFYRLVLVPGPGR
jgi:hypothetical protein